MSRRVQLFCAWCGPALIVLSFGGLVIAGFLPVPLFASATPGQVAQYYLENPTRIRFGFMIAGTGMGLIAPFLALVTVQMIRMESGRLPILSILQALCAAVTWIFLFLPLIVLNVAAFRPDRNPEITQALTDLGYLLFFTPVAPFLIQNFAIGTAILGDRSSTPVLPRWAGYANFWAGIAFIPALVAYYFKAGPFSWHGVFVYYIGFIVYGNWILMMFFVLRRAVLAQAKEEATREQVIPELSRV
jgi:hypothetical protein